WLQLRHRIHRPIASETPAIQDVGRILHHRWDLFCLAADDPTQSRLVLQVPGEAGIAGRQVARTLVPPLPGVVTVWIGPVLGATAVPLGESPSLAFGSQRRKGRRVSPRLGEEVPPEPAGVRPQT